MTFNPLPLVRLVGSRGFALLLVVASIAITLLGYSPSGANLLQPEGSAFGLPSPALWFTSPLASFIAALVADLIAMALIIMLVRKYNLIRDLRGGGMLMGAIYMLLEGARPAAGHFFGSHLLLLVVIASIFILYSLYQRYDLNRRILLIFVMLGTGVLFDYGFLPYLVVMVLGCAQMRVLNLRSLVAIVAGTFTPLWLLFAFGLIDFSRFEVPDFINILMPGNLSSALRLTAAALVAVVTAIFTGFLDMLQIYARNARTRAFFGLIAITGIMTALMCIVDFKHIDFYVPLLNFATAYFVTLLYSLRRRGSLGAGTVAIVILTLAFIVFYIWKIMAALT